MAKMRPKEMIQVSTILGVIDEIMGLVSDHGDPDFLIVADYILDHLVETEITHNGE